MATQSMQLCAQEDPANHGLAEIGIDFDDVSLLITGVHWQNTTARSAFVELFDAGTGQPVPGASATMQPGTQPASANVTPLNLHMVPKTNPKTNVTVPTSPMNCELRWPALR